MTVASRNSESAQPALTGTLRDCRPKGKGPSRMSEGDIALVDSADMTRRQAEALLAHRPSAVINLSRFSTGAMPNYGPHLLLDANVTLLEATGGDGALRDGKKVRLGEDGSITVGKKPAGTAVPITRGDLDATFAEAQRNLVEQMEAYFGNTIEFVHAEAPLLIDGLGAPDLGESMAERKVVVVSPCPDLRDRLKGIKNFMSEFTPVIVGVGQASDVLVELGFEPDYIVGDPTDVASESLRSGARVILPAEPDGFAPGLERIQDLGVGAMTFPAATESPTDLAILLAVFHDAEMIVTVGQVVELDQIFAAPESTPPEALLTRMKAGRKLVDSTVVEQLYAVPSSGGVAWAWAILGILVAIATIVLVVGLYGPGDFSDNLVNTWNSIALSFQDLIDRLTK